METAGIIIGVSAAVIGLAGLFGWSHKAINRRLDSMELELLKRPSEEKVRLVMSDKMAPLQTEYHSLTKRIDDLRLENHKLNDKMDRLLVICTKLSYEKEKRQS